MSETEQTPDRLQIDPRLALLAWDAAGGGKHPAVKVGPLLAIGAEDWSAGFDFTGGAAWAYLRDMSKQDALAEWDKDFIRLTIGYELAAEDVAEAFLSIEGWADRVTSDSKCWRAMGAPTAKT